MDSDHPASAPNLDDVESGELVRQSEHQHMMMMGDEDEEGEGENGDEDEEMIDEYVKLIMKVSYNRGADLLTCLTAVKTGSTDCDDGLVCKVQRH